MLIDRHIEALVLARDCVALGARHNTLSSVTGLSETLLDDLFGDQRSWRRSGRVPASPFGYLNHSLTDRVEAALFASLFDDRFTEPVSPAQALVSAYRLYLRYCGARPRLAFDVAFIFAGHLRGLWVCDQPTLMLNPCRTCQLASITVRGASFVHDCPFCATIKRYALDPRVRAHFPANARGLAGAANGGRRRSSSR